MFIRAGGVDVFVVDQGAGEPILFLHGNPDTADIWDGVICRLQPQYRCIAPDLPGFGRSAMPENFDCLFENLGSFIDQLVEVIGVDLPVNLVTHDFGGAFGMAWAIQHPKKVQRVVVINHPFFIADYRWHIWARIWRTPILGELVLLTINWPAFYQIVRYGSRQLTKESIRRAYSFITPQWKHMVLRLYRAAGQAAFRVWEPRMLQFTSQIDVLVLWGTEDPWVPVWVASRFGAEKIVHFPDSGHWLPAEDPEGVAMAIHDFVRL